VLDSTPSFKGTLTQPSLVTAANQSTGPLYNKIRSKLGRGLDLPTMGKNHFVDLTEMITKLLNLSNCWVCGGNLMSEEWP
jgi:hypothetical protein